jgi:hypothetical protein
MRNDRTKIIGITIPQHKRSVFTGLIIILGLVFAVFPGGKAASSPPIASGTTRQFYFPVVTNNFAPFTDSSIMLGIYPGQWSGTDAMMEDEYHSLELWSGEKISLGGTFVSFMTDPVINIELQLDVIARNGYTPFLNLNVTPDTGLTAKQIADGAIDNEIRAVARSYKIYTQGGTRMAFIAPLQEMNNNNVSYGLDPVNFKRAYLHIQQLFANEGVPRNTIRWVFAPNGSGPAGSPPFEQYYPGDDVVDVSAFTALHVGYCPNTPVSWQSWQTPDMVIGQYLTRMIALTPTKPIIISQTATSAYNVNGKDIAAKNQFLIDMYNYVADYPEVRGIIYLNWDLECDWAFYHKYGEKYDGYIQAVTHPRYNFISPPDLMDYLPYNP